MNALTVGRYVTKYAVVATMLLMACDNTPTDIEPIIKTPSPIVVSSPLAGTKFLQGNDTITVNFTPAKDSILVLFTYNLDNPPAYDTITEIFGKTANSVKFITPIFEGNFSNTAEVRILDKSGFDSAGTSNKFSVQPIKLTSPIGGSTYAVGQTIPVRWGVAEGAISSVKIEYSTDGGLGWITVGSGSVNKFDSNGAPNADWANYPLVINQAFTSVIVRISDYSARTKADQNSTPFKIQ